MNIFQSLDHYKTSKRLKALVDFKFSVNQIHSISLSLSFHRKNRCKINETENPWHLCLIHLESFSRLLEIKLKLKMFQKRIIIFGGCVDLICYLKIDFFCLIIAYVLNWKVNLIKSTYLVTVSISFWIFSLCFLDLIFILFLFAFLSQFLR